MHPSDGQHTEDAQGSDLTREVYVHSTMSRIPTVDEQEETNALPTDEKPLIASDFEVYFSPVEYYYLEPGTPLSPLNIHIRGPKDALYQLLQNAQIKAPASLINSFMQRDQGECKTNQLNIMVVLLHELTLLPSLTQEQYELARKVRAMFCKEEKDYIEGIYIAGQCHRLMTIDSLRASQNILNILTTNLAPRTRLSDRLYMKYLEMNLGPMREKLEIYHANILRKFADAIRAHGAVLAQNVNILSQSSQSRRAEQTGLLFQFSQICLSTVGYDKSSELKTKSQKLHEIERLTSRIDALLRQSESMKSSLAGIVDNCLPKATRMFDRGLQSKLAALLTEYTSYSDAVLRIYKACETRMTSRQQLTSAFDHANRLSLDINSLPDIVKSSPRPPVPSRTWR